MNYQDNIVSSTENFTVIDTQQVDFSKKRRKKRRARRIVALALCCTLIGSVVGVGGTALYYGTTNSTTIYENIYQSLPESISNITSLTSVSNAELTPSQLYAQNVGACVGIIVSNVSTNAFGQVSTTASSGSGFVITEDGYVVTNCHVIADVIDSDTLTIDVTFYDDTSYPATLVGYEEDNDVAVLKIDATNLQTITLGDSDDLEVGETVYAIGNPLGELTFSLTDGLVSALDRLISTDEGSTMNMFQTNTAINPGNSGGPVFNASGDVIGIATAKYSMSSSGTTVEGLGFALPINDVIAIVVDLMEYGYVTGKPYMGVQVVNASYYGAVTGAAVSYVAEDSAAEDAGIEIGDIITSIDGVAIDTSSALTAVLTAYSAGDSAVLTITRDSQTITLTIVFDEKNTDTEAANQIEIQQETIEQITPPSSGMPQMPNR
ncbi:MAG: trypsin-like peptidase domain-containing protein [Clostridia bacterium]